MLTTRAAWIFAVASIAALGCSSGDPAQSGEMAGTSTHKYDASNVELAVTAGVSGTIWVLDTYEGGGAHPGTNSIDIGASGGSSVWHQIDVLPAEIAGGWIYVSHVKEAKLCSQYSPGDAYYNGAKLRVFTYFYGIDGAYLGHHNAVYQHVEPSEGVTNKWLTWNNPAAGTMWPAPDVTLGTRADGGAYLGTLFSGDNKLITNGPDGKLCHSGDHLHQEGVGSRASLSLKDSVGGREDHMHIFKVNAIYPSPPGQPPEAPPAVGSAPPADPQDPPVTPEDPADPGDPGDPPEGTCACVGGVDNFCHYKAKTSGCDMTFPGGYCDPNGDGDFGDADWVGGWYDFKDQCGEGGPAPQDPPDDPPPPSCACKAGLDNFCGYAPKTAGCDMTFPGGYCDPNGDGSYADGDWDKGWFEYNGQCGS